MSSNKNSMNKIENIINLNPSSSTQQITERTYPQSTKNNNIFKKPVMGASPTKKYIQKPYKSSTHKDENIINTINEENFEESTLHSKKPSLNFDRNNSQDPLDPMTGL